jgi:hypothetical protein
MLSDRQATKEGGQLSPFLFSWHGLPMDHHLRPVIVHLRRQSRGSCGLRPWSLSGSALRQLVLPFLSAHTRFMILPTFSMIGRGFLAKLASFVDHDLIIDKRNR